MFAVAACLCGGELLGGGELWVVASFGRWRALLMSLGNFGGNFGGSFGGTFGSSFGRSLGPRCATRLHRWWPGRHLGRHGRGAYHVRESLQAPVAQQQRVD